MSLSTQFRASTWKYDVFLSFRGEDTRKGFTDYLHDKLQWRQITRQTRLLFCWKKYETELINEIVQALWSKVHPSPTVLGSSEMLVGMDTKLEEIDVLLDKEANDVRFIGIWGMGGLGKTTLARLVYEKISDQFEVSIFVSNVREVSASYGLVHLQKQILSQILKHENIQVWDVYSGITMTKRCLCDKAVLLVLDDADQVEQLETLVGERDWFGLRSRIIITTRNRHILVTHGIDEPYALKGLNDDEALKLFSWKAFRKYEPEDDYVEHSNSFVTYAGGLPLALKTLGSFLYKRRPDAWSSTLKKLKETPNKTVFDILKISYDGLDRTEKKIFLDIACFCRLWYQNEYAIELLYSSDFCSHIAIDVLVERSLITISLRRQVFIHDLLKEMGCEIVRQESEEPGRRSRLWLDNDIFHVFTRNSGTEAIEGIFLHLPKLKEADWNLESFSMMWKLKLLYIHNLRLSAGPKYLPNALRFLNWGWYPSKSLPPGFQPNDLIELSLPHSNIHLLWDGTTYLNKLKSIDLSYSTNLTRTPDFTGIQNLEKLVLEGCRNLVEVHPSIALLKRLKIWNLRNCTSIKSLPSEVKMEFLETFDVSGCSKLKMIPEFMGQMKRLSKLALSGNALVKLPSSIERFRESLVELDLSGIVKRERPYSLFLKPNLSVSFFGLFPRQGPHPLLPLLASLKHMSFLTSLKLNDCNLSEGAIPNDIGSLSSLQFLELRGNNFVTLPASIQLLSKLSCFNVENCKRLEQLPDFQLNGELCVGSTNCTSLQVFPGPSDLCRFNTIGNMHSSYFLHSTLKLLVEDPSFHYFSLVLPGSDIYEWFSNQSVGDSVTERIPSYLYNSSKWIGIAVCALFAAQDNLSGIPEESDLNPDENSITCSFRLRSFRLPVRKIGSDHLILCVFSTHYLEPENCLEDNLVKCVFETDRAVGNNRCLKVKKCGARALYEHEVKELIARMNHLKRKLVYELGGANVEEQCSCGSDNEYYSADE